MKILLANLPWEQANQHGIRAGSRWPHMRTIQEGAYLPFPFFLAYTARLLMSHEFDVKMIDALCEQMDENTFWQAVADYEPELLIVETATPSLLHDSALVKKHRGAWKVVFCGPEHCMQQENFLTENGHIDFIARGEYEYTVLELAYALKNKTPFVSIKGLLYRDTDGTVRRTPRRPLNDINTLPWPLRDDLPLMRYSDSPGALPQPTLQMLTSRGCPFGCTYCLWPQVMYESRSYRVRHVADVIDEMEVMVYRHKFKSVYFDDDTFGADKTWVKKFCEALRLRRAEGRLMVPWAMMTRPDLVDENILDELTEAGLYAVKYGIESGSDEIIARCCKRLDLAYAEAMIKKTHERGIKTHLTFMLGLPGETMKTIGETMAFILRVKPFSVQFSFATPFPGTHLFDELSARGHILSSDWSRFDGNTRCVVRTDALSARQIEWTRKFVYGAWRLYAAGRRIKHRLAGAGKRS